MPNKDDRWKEQLRFVTATTFVSGVGILMNMWPYVAMFQRSLNIHFWTTSLPGEMPQPRFGWFILLTFPSAWNEYGDLFIDLHVL